MKKIAGASIGIWIPVILVIAGLVWFGLGKYTHHPEAQAQECFNAARVLLLAEQKVRFARMEADMEKSMVMRLTQDCDAALAANTYDASAAASKWEAEEKSAMLENTENCYAEEMQRPLRAYDKALARLKEEEFLTTRYSSAVGKWLDDARRMFAKSPGNKKEAGKREVFLEQDLRDLLKR